MIRIPNPDEETSKVIVAPNTVGLIGEVSQEQIQEIKSNQLKIAKLRLKVLQKERKEIRAYRRKNKWTLTSQGKKAVASGTLTIQGGEAKDLPLAQSTKPQSCLKAAPSLPKPCNQKGGTKKWKKTLK